MAEALRARDGSGKVRGRAGVKPRPKVAPLRRWRWWPRWWRWRTAAERYAAVFWLVVFAVASGGYALLAPVVDDWRSGLRAMTRDCRVARVIDGDTVDLSCGGRRTLRARIVGYDSPELFSPGCAAELAAAKRARAALKIRVRHAAGVEVAFLGRDRYGRTLVDMRLGGQRVARGMVESGSGRRYFGHLRSGWCR